MSNWIEKAAEEIEELVELKETIGAKAAAAIILSHAPNVIIHEQVFVPVKTPLDKNIVPLVQALNLFDNILTFNSCECRSPDNVAQVDFTYHGAGSLKLFRFVEWLNHKLAGKVNSHIFYTLNLGWRYGGTNGAAEITVPPDQIEALSTALTDISVDATASQQKDKE